MKKHYENLFDPLLEMAERNPDFVWFVFVNEDGSEEQITAASLLTDVRRTAQQLRAAGLRAGQRMAISMPHSSQIIRAFLGAIYLGVVPTILPYLREGFDPVRVGRRISQQLAANHIPNVLTIPSLAQVLMQSSDLCVIDVEALADVPDAPADSPFGSLTDPMFIQFTSGTTSQPKSIQFNHQQIIRHAQALQSRLISDEPVFIVWGPLNHDMGLQMGLIIPLVAQVRSVIMSPFHWVRSPMIMLQAVSKHGGTVCCVPNFALNHSVNAIRERDLADIDLSTLLSIINAAEPVLLASHQIFMERFSKYGLRENILSTAYGMAEVVCGLTMTVAGEPVPADWISRTQLEVHQVAQPVMADDPDAVALLSCGVPLPSVQIRIVDADGQPLADRHVGDIETACDWLMDGYCDNPELTGPVLQNGWFNTGDLGYVADGHLYVTGRKKDLIIVGGRNVHPQFLEYIANGVPGVRAGRAVAFGIRDEATGTERPVILVEAEPDADGVSIQRELRLRVMEQLDMALGDARIVPNGWVQKSLSGKIAHAINRQRYEDQFIKTNPEVTTET